MGAPERSARKAAQYLFFGGIASKTVTFFGAIATARILSPEDYGYNLSITIVAGFLGILSFNGFETYFVQKRDIQPSEEKKILGNVFFLRIIQNLILFGLHLILATYLHRGDPVLGNMLYITSLVHLFGIIGKPSEAVLAKEFNFKPVVKSNLLRDILGVATRLSCALAGLGAYSFAIALVVGNMIRQVFLFVSNKTKARIQAEMKIVKPIFSFGGAVILGSLGNFVKTYSDKVILASFYPKAQVGLFDFARVQSDVVNTYLLYPQNGLVLSYLSKHKSSKEKIDNLFDSIGVVVSFVFFPIFMAFYFCMDFLVPFVFGEEWTQAIPFFKVFIIYGAHVSIVYPSQGILTSLGKPQIKTKITIGFTLISILALCFIAYYGYDLIYFAITYLVMSIVSDQVLLFVSLKRIGYSIKTFFKTRFSAWLLYAMILVLMLALQYVKLEMSAVLFIPILTFLYIRVMAKERFLNAIVVFLGANSKAASFIRKVLSA